MSFVRLRILPDRCKERYGNQIGIFIVQCLCNRHVKNESCLCRWKERQYQVCKFRNLLLKNISWWIQEIFTIHCKLDTDTFFGCPVHRKRVQETIGPQRVPSTCNVVDCVSTSRIPVGRQICETSTWTRRSLTPQLFGFQDESKKIQTNDHVLLETAHVLKKLLRTRPTCCKHIMIMHTFDSNLPCSRRE